MHASHVLLGKSDLRKSKRENAMVVEHVWIYSKPGTKPAARPKTKGNPTNKAGGPTHAGWKQVRNPRATKVSGMRRSVRQTEDARSRLIAAARGKFVVPPAFNTGVSTQANYTLKRRGAAGNVLWRIRSTLFSSYAQCVKKTSLRDFTHIRSWLDADYHGYYTPDRQYFQVATALI